MGASGLIDTTIDQPQQIGRVVDPVGTASDREGRGRDELVAARPQESLLQQLIA